MLLPTSKTFTSGDFPLSNGGHLPELTIAYETYGTLAGNGANAILLSHGYTSNPHAGGDESGWWSDLIGPGKAMDTDRYFVICANMLGSSYGSTGPASIDPATGAPYGPDFPDITTDDMVAAQVRLLDHLGVGQLAAKIGFSYGGRLTFLWGVTHPDRMRALIPVASGIDGRGRASSVQDLIDRFATCPGWNGGRYYGNEKDSGVYDMLVAMRIETLTNYGVAKHLEATVDDPAERERRLRTQATQWAEEFDANSLIALRKASIRFDATRQAANIKAPLLYVLSRTDSLFPPDLGPKTVDLLEGHGVDTRYFEIDSDYGHRGPSVDWAKWSDTLRDFLDAHAA